MSGVPGLAVEAGRIIKVNHAGEHGAVNIYAGQIATARLRARGLLPNWQNSKPMKNVTDPSLPRN